ncbi:MAG: amidase family protein, partial [Pseudomonadota bacterium]
QDQPLLGGITIAHKDLFCTKGIETTAGSSILKGFVPDYSAHIVRLLEDAGCVMVGKSNLDEFAMGSSNLTSHYGHVINPWKKQDCPDVDLVPGGSSGGSAAVVAAGLSLAATGTDTGGSIRQPAAFSGVFGIKPTYGRCSRWGIIAFASSLDQAGIFTRTVRDGAMMLSNMTGFDPMDSTSLQCKTENYVEACSQSIKGMRVGIAREYHEKLPDDISKLCKQAQTWLQDQGAELIEISLPMTEYALPCYYIIALAECSSNLARYDGVRYGLRVESETLESMYEKTREQGFGEEVKRRILAGTYVLSAGYYDAYYRKAQKIRRLIVEDFKKAFSEVDVLL